MLLPPFPMGKLVQHHAASDGQGFDLRSVTPHSALSPFQLPPDILSFTWLSLAHRSVGSVPWDGEQHLSSCGEAVPSSVRLSDLRGGLPAALPSPSPLLASGCGLLIN